MVSAAEALATILASVQPLETVTTALLAARGAVLSGDVRAAEDVPPFDNAAMDGYAVHGEDLGRTGATLRLVGEVPAGATPERTLLAGETMAVMTGAIVPPGAAAIVQQEWTEQSGEGEIRMLRAVQPGHNIRAKGSDIKRASVVLQAGTRLGAPETGVLASLGERFVSVYRKPRVGILATGNELTPLDAPLAPARIRNSNSYALAAAVGEAGGTAALLGIAPDEAGSLRDALAAGLRHDMLVTTGGVSVGKYDFVRETLQQLGVELKFWKVNIKPGMPLLFGVRRTTPVFGLPGNPVSSLVTFSQFVKPALRKMRGERDDRRTPRLSALLLHDMEKHDGKRHYVRGILESDGVSLTVRSTGSQMSNVLTSLTRANCLVILPEQRTRFAAGERVEVELL